MTIFRTLIVLALIACLAPLAATMGAGLFAAHHGCTLHEGFINPCVVSGTDYGKTLYTLGMMGWLMIFTIPAAAAVLLLWFVVEIAGAVRRRRARARNEAA